MNPTSAVTDGSLSFAKGDVNGQAVVIQRDGSGAKLQLRPQAWRAFRKIAETRAARIAGPFTVETSEGPLKCQDGWVAVDARGYPYPIAADEFALIYEPVSGRVDLATVHPAIAGVLQFFHCEHLPEGEVRETSRRFRDLAHRLACELDGAELTVALRHLLEAKDAAVRAAALKHGQVPSDG